MPELSIWDRLMGMLPGDPNYDPYVTPKGTTLTSQPAAPDPQILYKTASPLVNITDQDINRGMDLGMSFSGGGLGTRPPSLLGTYHATGAPTEFSQFKLPPPSHDLGIHTTIDPNVADAYAYPKSDKGVDFMSGTQFGAPDAAGVRIKPVLTDVRNAMKYPIDAGKWNYAENVIPGLENAMYRGFKAPRGILEDMHNISGTDKIWQEQFAPMLQDRGIDSLFYPHSSPYSDKKFNTFMVLDPKQVIPRFSEEGQALIADRGVKEPMIADRDKWRVPQGVLYNPNAVDTLKGTLDEGASPFIQDKYTKHQEFMDSIGTKTALEKQFQKQLDAAPDWTTKLAAYKQAYDNNLFSKESFEFIQNNILKKIADKEPVMWFKK
jgi:hypothetical protein